MSRNQLKDGRRRRVSAFLPFLGAVLEIVVFVVVGNLIGFGWAIVLALGTSVVGLWLMRRAGFRAWRSLRAAAADAAAAGNPGAGAAGGPTHPPRDQTGVVAGEPTAEERIADAGVTLLAGTALVVPGFVSDLLALVLLIPPIRRKVGRRLASAALRTFPGPRAGGPQRGRPGQVVEGEVVDWGPADSRRPDATEDDGA